MIPKGTKGYRYVRAYRWPKDGGTWRYALWEHDGERCRRVGTAYTEADYLTHLGLPADFHTRDEAVGA